jgi:threonine/homoserine/homoserine lactone efflux protein
VSIGDCGYNAPVVLVIWSSIVFHPSGFDSARFFVFLSAAILLAIAPGPGMLYVLARALGGGRREGLFSALGTLFGGMAHVFAAAAGVSIILAKSAVAFAAVKYLGAAYLCFLGIRMMREAGNNDGVSVAELPRRRNPFWQGVLTEVLNPKTALFFLSFIPQFVDRATGTFFCNSFSSARSRWRSILWPISWSSCLQDLSASAFMGRPVSAAVSAP